MATGADLPPILSLQNGVDNEPLIAERLGADRVITGTVTTAVGKPGIGQVVEEKRRGIGIALDHPLGADDRRGAQRRRPQRQRLPGGRAR